MKFLFFSDSTHRKNINALKKYNLDMDIVENAEQLQSTNVWNYNVVISPAKPVNAFQFKNIKFIFGPHFSTFPTQKITGILELPNVTYIQPSPWTVATWKNFEICSKLNIECLPFGVDTDTFNESKPITERKKVFVYLKHRDPNEFLFLKHYFLLKNIEYKIFDYNIQYNEKEYIDYLQEAKYGIWIGCHESQGFALEEALSCNVPLFVWNVKSMKQEHECGHPDVPATSIPYWDSRCGEFFYDVDDFQLKFKEFLSKLEQYKPRDYILENLSIDVCKNKLLDLCA